MLPLSSKESWIRVSGVDFGTAATGFVVQAASAADGNKIEIHTGSASGTLAGTCTLKNTGNKSTFAENKCDVEGLKGVVDQIFLVFKGDKDSTMAIKAWGFEGSGSTPPEPQKPYDGEAIKLPAKIEAEKYDIPGTGRGGDVDSYSDSEGENQGDADFRADQGVDIVLGGTGMAIGYTAVDEWLEYTVDVPADGEYAIKAYASTGMENGASFCFMLDGKTLIGDTIKVPQTGEDWSVYKEFDGGKATLTKGTHVIRLLITGDNVNVDWFSLGDVSTISLHATKFHMTSAKTYNVYNLAGKRLGSVDLVAGTAAESLKAAGFRQGVYMLRSMVGNKKFMVSTAR